jgi:putative ABC transport system substrate-binding protein
MRFKTVGLAMTFVLAILLAPFTAAAQQPGKIYRIGLLTGSSPGLMASANEAFQQGLRELGYVEGKNVIMEYRYAEGNVDLLPELAADLVRIKVDIIVSNDPMGRAAKHATTTIPIVIAGLAADPVEAGLVESLARPGGNITGLTSMAFETAGKRLELLKETVPTLVRVATLYDPANPGNVRHLQEVQTAGRARGLTVQAWEVRGTDDFERVFAALGEASPDGFYVLGGPLTRTNAKRIVDFAVKSRLPSVTDLREAVEAGALLYYAADDVDQFRRAAYYVDKILKGTKPADLPVERAMKFELVINLKTAQQIGLTVPPEVLLQADKVIK